MFSPRHPNWLLPLCRRWIKVWTGGKKLALRIKCEDRHEAEAFQHLLAFVHSAGRTLPDGGSEAGGGLRGCDAR